MVGVARSGNAFTSSGTVVICFSRSTSCVMSAGGTSMAASTVPPVAFRYAARTVTAPTFAGSVAAVATQGLPSAVIASMSALEMSAP